jgi:hypothetical protein
MGDVEWKTEQEQFLLQKGFFYPHSKEQDVPHVGGLLAGTHIPPLTTYIRRTAPLEINFIYLGNNEICCTFKTCCAISVLLFIS